jgi:hypothetical protein
LLIAIVLNTIAMKTIQFDLSGMDGLDLLSISPPHTGL